MSPIRRGGPPWHRRVLIIVLVVGVLAWVVVLVGALLTSPDGPGHPPPLTLDDAHPPVSAEADVFRIRPRQLGVDPAAPRDSLAHPRTLELYRRIREFPGAPPRIPHGLTRDEFREGTCNTCHLRGGYVARFGSYAPLSPHPDRTACLQCHVPRDTLVGIPRSSGGAALICAQCHVDPDARPATFVDHEWVPAAWPEVGRAAMPEAPPPIPHPAEGRAACLACHAGPAAVVELRTDHPERTSCRQCHVPADGEPVPVSQPGPMTREGGGTP